MKFISVLSMKSSSSPSLDSLLESSGGGVGSFCGRDWMVGENRGLQYKRQTSDARFSRARPHGKVRF